MSESMAPPPLDLAKLIALVSDEAFEILKCPCGASRFVLTARDTTDEEIRAFTRLHLMCPPLPRLLTLREIYYSA